MGVKIISDSACDLPKSIIEDLNIDIMPILVFKDEEEYLDGETIIPKDIYKNMREGGIVYKTAQIPPTAFKEEFEKLAKSEESVIYIAFSSGLSGTYQTSLMVRDSLKDQYPNMDIDIVDSRAASVGMGLIVEKAGLMAKEGKSKEEILKALDFYIEHMEHIFTVDDIEYLFKGGRVSRTQAFVGGLLNIKPILCINEEGKLVALEKVRGHKKVLKKMLSILEEKSENVDLSQQIVGINHADDLESAMALKDAISEKYGVQDFIINYTGCAIGAHTGPGNISLFFLNKDYKG